MSARDDRRPLPPEILADALQDRIVPASGRLLKAQRIMARRILQRLLDAAPAPEPTPVADGDD